MTTKSEMVKMVRLFCNECMGGGRSGESYAKGAIAEKIQDIEGCTAPECVWFPFRMGEDPWPNKRRVLMGKLLAEAQARGPSRL